MLDCKPFMMRGVSYSPVPWSHDPSYHEPFGDYFTDEFHDIVKRDLELFVEMGANTARIDMTHPYPNPYPYSNFYPNPNPYPRPYPYP
jgi:hypothetical protein